MQQAELELNPQTIASSVDPLGSDIAPVTPASPSAAHPETHPETHPELRSEVRPAQQAWAAASLRTRVELIRSLRKRLALKARTLAETVPLRLDGALNRTVADTLASEVLPLIEACRFLERQAAQVLRTRYLPREGSPRWLGKVDAEVERSPWGIVLILGASNYPLLLAGTQCLQALVAGNAVLWKPAPGTEAVAHALRNYLLAAGLPAELLTILETSIESATAAIDSGVDHIVLTGSAQTGRQVLRQAAETLTPATLELSGCDAVFILPGADIERAIEALVFGLRFNGSCTCMAPRRLFLVGLSEQQAADLEGSLATALDALDAVPASEKTDSLVQHLIEDAIHLGAQCMRNGITESDGKGTLAPTLLVGATAEMLATRTDIFAPILSVIRVADMEHAIAVNAACPYALTSSIFGPARLARSLASRLRAGNVLINDIVTATADPRISFGGRGKSGFGVTRGREGLLGMTTPRTIQHRRGKAGRIYQSTGDLHIELFAAMARMLHSGSLVSRVKGMIHLAKAGRALANKPGTSQRSK